MSLVQTILALASAGSAIFATYAFGHWLSNHHTMPLILSGVFFLLTALLVVIQIRMPQSGTAQH